MSSGQWDLQALEAIEREASEIFDVLDVPERLRSPANKQQKQQNNCAGSKKMPPCRSFCGGGSDQHHHGSGASSPIASAASATAATDENMDFELQDHIKHCSCSCNHMGYGNYMDYQQTSCFGGLPDVTEHTHSTNNNNNNNHHKNGKRLCKFNKQQLPPLLETLTSNESLPSLEAVAAQQQQTLTTAATSSSGSTSILVTTADAAAAALLTNKPHSFDIFDTKHCFFPSAPVVRASSALALPEALLASSKSFSPTGSLKYGPFSHSGYGSPVLLENGGGAGRGFGGICGLGLTTLRLNAKCDNGGAGVGGGAPGDGDVLFGGTDLNADLKGRPLGDGVGGSDKGKSSGQGSDRRWCLCVVTFFIALTVCVVVVSFILEVSLGDGFIMDRSSEDFRLRTIRQLLRETPLIDGHNDLAWNIKRFSHNRFEFLNLSEGLEQTAPYSNSPWSQTDIPKLKKGQVGAQFWSAYVPCEAQGLDAVQLALEQIDVIQRFTVLYDQFTTLATSSKQIVETHRRGQLASMIGVEGGHALGSSLGVLRTMYTLGVRYLTLTHKCDISWAGSSATLTERGLSPFGRSVVKEMNRLGMIIDLSHSSDQTAREVLKETRAPVIYSHSAARTLCNLSRNIDDELLRMIAENGGIVMVSFYSVHISCRQISTISDVIAHINYIRAVAGVQHIGIGAGYDGIDRPPIGLEDVSKYPDLFVKLLEDPNWSQQDISLLAGKNFLRVFESVENVRDYWASAQVPPIEKSEPLPKSPCAYMPL